MEFKESYNKLVIKKFFIKKDDNKWYLCGKDEKGDCFKIDPERGSYKNAKDALIYCRGEYTTPGTNKLTYFSYSGIRYRMWENSSFALSYAGQWHSVYEIL